jgi:hypothetical protein
MARGRVTRAIVFSSVIILHRLRLAPGTGGIVIDGGMSVKMIYDE